MVDTSRVRLQGIEVDLVFEPKLSLRKDERRYLSV
jgi:hypothetical protein